MKFLNEDITITLYNLNIPADSTYQYQVSVGNELLFVGNCFITTGDTNYTFYLNDILNRYMFNGKVQDGYNSNIINKVYLELIINDSTSYGDSIEVAFLYPYPNKNGLVNTPISVFDTEYWLPLLQGFDYISGNSVLLPTYPYTFTNKLPFNYLGIYGSEGVVQRLESINTETAQNTSLDYPFEIGNNIKNGVYGLGNYIMGDILGISKSIAITNKNMRLISSFGTNIYTNGVTTITSRTLTSELARVQVVLMKDGKTQKTYKLTYTSGSDLTIDLSDNLSNAGYDTLSIGLFLGSDLNTQVPSLVATFDVTNMFNRPIEYNVPLVFVVSFNSLTNTVTLKNEYAEINEEYAQPNKLYVVTTPADTTVTITEKKTYIANIDYCSRYYLRWMDRYGMSQIQPFEGTTTYSEGFDYNETINYRNERKHSVINVQPKWRINTKWLDKTVYPFYESIFVSPYLQLYDAQEDEIYNVVITNTDYVEKTFKNQNKQQFNLQLDIELNKKQSIIY